MTYVELKIVEPKIRGFLCTAAHPKGCQAHVHAQAGVVERRFKLDNVGVQALANKPKRVLIIGGSAGYGLASRITCALGYGAKTLSVSLEKPARMNKPASAGWYNNYFVAQLAQNSGLYAESITGDAFSDAVKQQAINTIKDEMGTVDLVVYSLASPRRVCASPSGEMIRYSSSIKPIGQAYSGQTVETKTGQLIDFSLEPASPKEIEDTITVMGGEDWYLWMKALKDAGVLAEQAQTVAFSYLGGDMTKAIYGEATLGAAKEDVERYCCRINGLLGRSNDLDHSANNWSPQATVAVLKAIVTQSSAAIPSLPLYISVLYRVMKEQGLHEGCIEQIVRLFQTGLYPNGQARCQKDKPYRFRLDELEMKPQVQKAVSALWSQVTAHNLQQLTDVEGYQQDFLRLFGFGWPSIDYQQAVNVLL
jgi:enoyl-[acyl-carrier protein] reductase/trans-2-enoyl-CoA reductase (NAD+)